MVVNFFSNFPGLHYVDPPYDWKKITFLLHEQGKKSEETIIVTTSEPHMFAPVQLYEQFTPIRNVRVINISEALSPYYQKNLKRIFLLDIDKTEKSISTIQKLQEFYNCTPKQIEVDDYIYYVECTPDE